METADKNPQTVLLKTFESRDIKKFKFLLEILKADVNQSFPQFGGLSMFQMVLKTPQMSEFIELCIFHGADLYQQNEYSFLPIHFAIQSLCAGNLKMLLRYSKSFTTDDIEFYSIINCQLDGGTNFLHQLVENLRQENRDEVSEMMKILAEIGCNLNLRNDSKESPMDCLVKKVKDLGTDSSLVEHFMQNFDIDFDSSSENEATNENSNIKKGKISINDLLKMLRNRNEIKFCAKFEHFTLESNSLADDVARLMEQAILSKSNKVVNLLLESDADVNFISIISRFKLPPAFLACRLGFSDILKSLLDVPNLNLTSPEGNSILHVICASNMMNNNLKTCFELIFNDDRCDYELVNRLDAKGFSALFYSSLNGFEDFSLQLLHRGAYIGHKLVVKTMGRELLEKCLDESVRAKNRTSEVHINFRFLKIPDDFTTEFEPLLEIAENENLQDLILHPVLVSFSKVKWSRVNLLVYLNLLIWFSMMTFLIGFIVIFFQNSAYNQIREFSGSWEIKDKNSSLYIMTNAVDNGIHSALNFFTAMLENPPPSLKNETKYYGLNRTSDTYNESFYEIILNSGVSDSRCEVFKLMVEAVNQSDSCLARPFQADNVLKLGFIFCTRFALCCPFFGGIQDSHKLSHIECRKIKEYSESLDRSSCFESLPMKSEFYQFEIKASFEMCQRCRNYTKASFDGCDQIVEFYVDLAYNPKAKDCSGYDGINWAFSNFFSSCNSCDENDVQFEDYFDDDDLDCMSSEDLTIVKAAHDVIFQTCTNLTKISARKKRKVDLTCDADQYMVTVEVQDVVVETTVEHHIRDFKTSYNFSLFIVYFLLTLEIIEFAFSFRNYFKNFNNWLDLSLVIVSLVVFSDNIVLTPAMFRKLRVLLILLMAAQSIQLITTISLLSVSFHFTIFKKVSLTFIKSISLYSIMILAFAMSFFTLFGYEISEGASGINCVNEPDSRFCNPKFSGLTTTLVTTIRMMLSDFDSSGIETGEDAFTDIILLLFVFFIAVVLFNLLNGLAVTDTQNLKLEAELVDMKKRISVICSYEKLFSILRIKTFDVFSSIIPNANIVLTPKQNLDVKTEIPFGDLKDCVIPFEPIGKAFRFEPVYRFHFMSTKVKLRFNEKFVLEIIKFVEAKKAANTAEEIPSRLSDDSNMNSSKRTRIEQVAVELEKIQENFVYLKELLESIKAEIKA